MKERKQCRNVTRSPISRKEQERYIKQGCINKSVITHLKTNPSTTFCDRKIFTNPGPNGLYRPFEVSFNSTSAIYHCHRNHHLVTGDLVHHCQDDGTWSGTDPLCDVDVYMNRYLLSSTIAASVTSLFFVFLFVHFCRRLSKEKKNRCFRSDKNVVDTLRRYRCKRLLSFNKCHPDVMKDAIKIMNRDTFDPDYVARIDRLEALESHTDIIQCIRLGRREAVFSVPSEVRRGKVTESDLTLLEYAFSNTRIQAPGGRRNAKLGSKIASKSTSDDQYYFTDLNLKM